MLQLTSLLFASNAAHAFTKRHLFYAVALIFLTACSVAWHSSEKLNPASMTRFWMDQAAAITIVILSIFYAFRMNRTYVWPLIALIAIAVALSYYLCRVCTWDSEAPGPHAALHVTACLGIHCIIAGL